MQMGIARTRIATVADKAYLLSDGDSLPFGKSRHIARQMRIIGQPAPIGRADIGGHAPGFTLKQFFHAPSHCSDHWRTQRGRNVNRLMHARATITGLQPRIDEAVGCDTDNWYSQRTSSNRRWCTGRGRNVGRAGVIRRPDDDYADRKQDND